MKMAFDDIFIKYYLFLVNSISMIILRYSTAKFQVFNWLVFGAVYLQFASYILVHVFRKQVWNDSTIVNFT